MSEEEVKLTAGNEQVPAYQLKTPAKDIIATATNPAQMGKLTHLYLPSYEFLVWENIKTGKTVSVYRRRS